MAYFPNGTAGQLYRARYCARCIHDEDGACPVWLLHCWSASRTDGFLHVLIPRSKDGLDNEQCRLFADKARAGA